MSRTLAFDAVQSHLRQIIEGMIPGEELVLTSQGEPLAVVTRPPRTRWPCEPGSAKNTKHWMAPDFDAPLEVFKEYME
jgi:antitoxin (DNA-binding transcriptional repressor) of toxin-antitoxin stability system